LKKYIIGAFVMILILGFLGRGIKREGVIFYNGI
jgi:hypothetical protein